MYDIALLKLEERVDLSLYPPVCLPFDSSANLTGETGSVFGWGESGNETSTDVLQEAKVPIVESSNCAARLSQTEGVNGSLIVCRAV